VDGRARKGRRPGPRPWIPEAQGSGPLAVPDGGLANALEERGADGIALTGTFDPKVTTVDATRLVNELGSSPEFLFTPA
jgi:hypothetical protein